MNPLKAFSPLRKLRNSFNRVKSQVHRQGLDLEEVKINQGLILSRLNEQLLSKDLHRYEFKVFSQWGEDGIIQHLVRTVGIRHKTFIEFGIQDFSESNCRFLLMKDNWQGFVIDGAKENIESLKSSYYYWRYHLCAIDAFVTAENIDALLAGSGFEEDLGVLSIDIDGNDYYLLEAITRYRPRILICEYNSVFGAQRKISVPYAADFVRTAKHHSNLYFGASLPALTYLANRKGYTLVGSNSVGSNAFFVRNDLMNDALQALSAEQAFVSSHVRESRDAQGRLTYLTGADRLELIRGMPVYNVESRQIEAL